MVELRVGVPGWGAVRLQPPSEFKSPSNFFKVFMRRLLYIFHYIWIYQILGAPNIISPYHPYIYIYIFIYPLFVSTQVEVKTVSCVSKRVRK